MMTMQTMHMAIRNRLRAGVVMVALTMVSACTEADMTFENFGKSDPDRVPEAAKTPQDIYPILVKAQRTQVNVPGRDGTDHLTASETRRVDDIVTAFIANARGQLVISVPGAAATDARVLGRAKQIADHAKRRGLAPSRILLRVDTEDQNADSPVSVGFETLVAVVSDCGDWSKESTHDYWNIDYSNHGCAVQHNIGLMIADPADLVTMRTMDYRDTVRSDGVIQAYRAGESTGATRASEEQATAIATE